ncbi:sugar phosphate isomerase/epimerase [Mucilaginibacter sp. UR6-11]|uniref:sugar phosphate isomerase/epimerase family protein n=1 Tax=Mucilaginibacter sp. UR6-11 TaxID=1435644 RepID=UPI001E30A631|nr:sugar phosphate isomerase/epimerase family protein [Mucilaginibacter sp. UR6-11]MCC8426539.1 sugar phosphate isomerase/epimerase [Mucilaginibacter sp. UR6-11]
MRDDISRKNFIKGAAVTLAGIPLGAPVLGRLLPASSFKNTTAGNAHSLNIFSKHLQWLNYADMARQAAQLGFDGIDLTVRTGGHVLPERVADDLPKALEAVTKAGLKINSITTDIKDADDKYTIDILKTASQLAIKNYRMGWYNYDKQLDTLANLAAIKKRFAGLAAINKQYEIHGDYENHTGRFGNSIWDLWEVLKDLDPEWIGCQYDIHHATVDGAEAWPVNLELIRNYIGSITIKDFYWKKTGDKWQVENVPLGQGMIDFRKYLALLKKLEFKGPVILHYEYPLGGANDGATKLAIPEAEVIKAMKADVITLKGWLAETRLQ